MEYMLTKDDIAKLVAAGLPGAMEGEIATPEDLQALGVTPQDTPGILLCCTQTDDLPWRRVWIY